MKVMDTVMNFVKMEGLANDFILTHDVQEQNVDSYQQKAAALCDRRRGIGADGIIFVLPSSTADFRMRIFNADGSEPEMCGNGIRCFGKYVKRLGLSSKTHLTVETRAGIIGIDMNGEMIRVNMGAPVLEASLIPTAKASGAVIMVPVIAGDRTFAVTAVSMGNPHGVVYADELTDELVLHYGKLLEAHPFFPKKANIEFIKVINDHEIHMRVYERGCGETMACGTGACAGVVAGVLNEKHGTSVTVHLLGGDLHIEWDGNSEHPVFMTGPAQWVYEGEITV
jgi:diaminopimelate epimerase